MAIFCFMHLGAGRCLLRESECQDVGIWYLKKMLGWFEDCWEKSIWTLRHFLFNIETKSQLGKRSFSPTFFRSFNKLMVSVAFVLPSRATSNKKLIWGEMWIKSRKNRKKKSNLFWVFETQFLNILSFSLSLLSLAERGEIDKTDHNPFLF